MLSQQLTTFITAHWQLVLLFVVLLLSLTGLEIRNKLLGIPKLSPAQATQAINHQSAILLDVRTKEQFGQGHIVGSVNRPWTELSKQPQITEFDTQKPVIAICEQGLSAQKAATMLRKSGFAQASILQGGLTAWRSAGLPLAKKGAKSCPA